MSGHKTKALNTAKAALAINAGKNPYCQSRRGLMVMCMRVGKAIFLRTHVGAVFVL